MQTKTTGTEQMNRTLSVLLVENDPDAARLLSIRLKNIRGCPIRVHTSCSLNDAIKELDRTTYGAILLDLQVDNSCGMNAFYKLKPYAADAPIIIWTNMDDEALAIEAVRRGAQDYLIKGIDNAKHLVRAIRYSIERQKILRKLDHTTKKLVSVNARLEGLSYLDPLTELLNRRGLERALSREVYVNRRADKEACVILLDLDNFKEINDAFGYAVGDLALREIAKRLRLSIRQSDYVGRIGGDEFIIILPGARHLEGIGIAEKLRMAISKEVIFMPAGKSVTVSGTIGTMMIRQDILSIDEILSSTYPSLAQGKMLGKNQVFIHNRGENPEPKPSTLIGNILQNLCFPKNFHAVEQPIVRLKDQRTIGYERLTRFSSDLFNMPDNFFRIAMENKMLTLVDRHCLKACLKKIPRNTDGLKYHVNLFPSTLIETPPSHLLEILAEASDPKSFCIEISEQQIVGDPSYLIHPLKQIKRAGVSIALDDVGFGHSCLEGLILLEPDIVKTDKKFLSRDALITPKGHSPLHRLLKILRSLNAQIIAEGVEDEHGLSLLSEHHVHYAQGYLFGRPQ